jgi:hypothetical protein
MRNSNRIYYPVDVAGHQHLYPHYLQTRARINRLIKRYLSLEILSDRLLDLPVQFETPHQRLWDRIHWERINCNQIISIDPELFLKVIAGAVEVEAPIRAYAKENWDYLQGIHPQMARFMGGQFAGDGSLLEVGIWEKEERQHSPVFGKIYQQLTGEKLQQKPNTVQGYHSTGNLRKDVYKHAISRIATEWSATSVYLWLMAHSTGELQQAIAQPLQDEVNHLAKFWGFSRWAFADPYLIRLKDTTGNLLDLLKHHKGERSHGDDILQLKNSVHAIELTFTLAKVMGKLRRWNYRLNRRSLEPMFGSSPFKRSSRIIRIRRTAA